MRVALLALLLVGCGGGPGPSSLNWSVLPSSNTPPSFGDAPTHGEFGGPASPTAGHGPPSQASGPVASPHGMSAGGGGTTTGNAVAGVVSTALAAAAAAGATIWAAKNLECDPSADAPSSDGKLNLCTHGAD